MVMTREVKFASSSYGLELVVGQTASEMTPGGCQSVIKNIVRVIHLIDPENRLQATLIQARVVCDQGKALDARGDLLPHIWEYWSSVGVFRPQAVNPLTEPLIVIGLGMNEAVEGIHYLSITNDYHPYTAYAGWLLVGSFEIYCREIFHLILQVVVGTLPLYIRAGLCLS